MSKRKGRSDEYGRLAITHTREDQSDFIPPPPSPSRTHWSDVKLVFSPPPTHKYYLENEGRDVTDIYDSSVHSAITTASVSGSGVSLWKSMNIDFDIR